MCVILEVKKDDQTRRSACSPSGNDGTCLGEVLLPAGWWPSVTNGKLSKHPKIVTHVSYSVIESQSKDCVIQEPMTEPVIVRDKFIGNVPLSLSTNGFRQISQDEMMHMLIPQSPLFPRSKMYVPVFFEQPRESVPVAIIALKCRARKGVRISGIEETSKNWTMRADVNSRGTVATVTAFRKNANNLKNTSLILLGYVNFIDFSRSKAGF